MSETGSRSDDGAISPARDPFDLFQEWMKDAEGSEVNDANAMALATVDRLGRPNVRMVLLKGVSQDGFVFYTNRESAKGRELEGSPYAALNFHWKSLRRAVRARGTIREVGGEEADAYFATRPKDSQIGAWASAQSRPMQTRFAFEKEIARYAAKFALGKVPRPPYWTGFRLSPVEIEFWRDRPFRLHDRLVFRREGDGPWRTMRLYP